MKLAIIGAGVTGLAAAHRLHSAVPPLEIVVFEKSKAVGGRVATRRFNGATFDHGAQYIKTPSLPLHELLTKELAHETLHDIPLPVWTFDRDNRIAPGDPQQNAEKKWSYEEGNTQLAKELARNLDVRFDQRISRLARAEAGWALWTEDNNNVYQADAVLLTPPAPQTAEIIADSDLPSEVRDALAAELAKVIYRQILTVTLGYPRRPRPRPYYALVNSDKQHPISWLAFEHLKAGRKTAGQGVYILQMGPAWSSEHWDDAPNVLAAAGAELLTALLSQPLRSPLWSNRQAWRYALPDGRADFDTLNAALPGLFFAGDFTAGLGRVHLAIEQGWAVAERLQAYLTP